MLVVVTIWTFVTGLLLVKVGRPRKVQSTPLPTAKVEDGQPVKRARRESRGVGTITVVLGVALMMIGPLLLCIRYVVSSLSLGFL